MSPLGIRHQSIELIVGDQFWTKHECVHRILCSLPYLNVAEDTLGIVAQYYCEDTWDVRQFWRWWHLSKGGCRPDAAAAYPVEDVYVPTPMLYDNTASPIPLDKHAIAAHIHNPTALRVSQLAPACNMPDVTNTVLQTISSKCTKLRSIDVSWCSSLTDASIQTVASHCSNLAHISADATSLTDAAIQALAAGCPNLLDLSLTSCESLTDAAFLAVARNCPNLTALNASECHSMTNASILALAANCHNLTVLDVSNCPNFTDRAILAVASSFPALTKLCVTDCALTDASIKAVAANCANLEHLSVAGCSRLTDKAITRVAINCKPLTHLEVGGCKLTNAAIYAIACYCEHLTHLDVSYCTRLTDEVIDALGNNSVWLSNLIVTGCDGLSDAAIQSVKETYEDFYFD